MARKEIMYGKMDQREREQLSGTTSSPALMPYENVSIYLFRPLVDMRNIVRCVAEFAILSTVRHPNIVEYHHREHIKAEKALHMSVIPSTATRLLITLLPWLPVSWILTAI